MENNTVLGDTHTIRKNLDEYLKRGLTPQQMVDELNADALKSYEEFNIKNADKIAFVNRVKADLYKHGFFIQKSSFTINIYFPIESRDLTDSVIDLRSIGCYFVSIRTDETNDKKELSIDFTSKDITEEYYLGVTDINEACKDIGYYDKLSYSFIPNNEYFIQSVKNDIIPLLRQYLINSSYDKLIINQALSE